MRPERGSVHEWRLCRRHQRRYIPYECALNAQQLFGLHGVRLVQYDARLILAPLQLIEYGLGLWAHIQLGWVVDQKDDVGPIDKPLAGVVKGKDARDLLAYFEYARYLNDVDLKAKITKIEKFVYQMSMSMSVSASVREYACVWVCVLHHQHLAIVFSYFRHLITRILYTILSSWAFCQRLSISKNIFPNRRAALPKAIWATS